MSDVYLTEHCGILNKLLPGDLADRGFSIQDSASLCCAEVKVPSFTKGKAQLSKHEVDSTRELARVHIHVHVERVIGLLRQKFKILSSTLPVNLVMCNPREELSMIDKIVVVCAALCNCCESVVPFD